MAKSLKHIESGLSGKGGSTSGAVGGLAGSVTALSNAVSNKKFNKANATSIIAFTRELVDISSKVNPSKAKSFAEFAMGMGGAFDMLLKVFEPKNMLKLAIGAKFGMPLIVRIVSGVSDMFSGLDGKNMKRAGEGLKALGEGLQALTRSMGTLALIGIAAPFIAAGALVLRLVVGLFANLGKKSSDISKGGKAMQDLGKGLIAFSSGLATLLLVIFIAKPAAMLLAIAVLASFAVTFALLGQASRAIRGGAESIYYMSIGLLGFSIALATFMVAILLSTVKSDLAGIGIIALLAGTFALLGNFEAPIRKGAQTMREMGAGLIYVSVGLMLFAIAMKIVDAKTAILGPLILVGLGGAFAIIGLLNKGNFVDSGADAMKRVGLALLLISAGIFVFGLAIEGLKRVFKDDLAKAGIIGGAIILGLGLAFAVVGADASLIAPGAAAMITVGLALLSISGGILVFGLALTALRKLFPKGLGEAAETSGKILLGLGLAFAGIGLVSIAIIPGAAAGILMGVALLSMSFGIWTFGNTLSGLYSKKLIDSKGEMKGLGIISTLGVEFAKLGLTALFAIPGIATGLMMGVALYSIAKGLSATASVIADIKDPRFTEKLFGDAGMVTSLARGFKDIGKLAGGGIINALSFMMGTDPVSKGIQYTKAMGDALSEIAGGIASFADFDNFPVRIAENGKLVWGRVSMWDVMGKIKENLPKLLVSLGDAFSQVATGESLEIGFGPWAIKIPGGDSKVVQGAKAVSAMGGALMSIAGGVASFANFNAFPIQVVDPKDPSKLVYGTVDIFGEVVPKIQQNLPKLLTALSKPFADIGAEYGESFFTDSDVKKGGDVIKSVGDGLSALVGGVVGFANFEKFPVQIAGPDGKLVYMNVNLYEKIGDIGKNVKTVISAVAGIFADINSIVVDDSKLDALERVAKSFEKFGKAGDGFGKFAGGFGTFSKDMGIFSKNFAILAPNTEKFASFSTSLNKNAEHAAGFTSFAKDFKSISSDMKVFAENFKEMNADTIVAFKDWTEAITEFVKVDVAKLSENAKASRAITIPSGAAPTVRQATNQTVQGNNPPIDLTPMLTALAALTQEVQKLSNKFKTGQNGGIITSAEA